MRGLPTETASAILRRFVRLVLISYAALSLGLWAVHQLFPDRIGGISDYSIGVSLMIAATFGALYAFVLVLWPRRRRDDMVDEVRADET